MIISNKLLASALCFLLAGIFIPGLLAGQPRFGKDYLLEVYNDESNLPQNTVRSLQFDGKGYLWLATEFGLVRFDGQHFKTYNTGNTPLLHTNRIQRILKDLKGHLYISDGEKSILYINEVCQTLEKSSEFPDAANFKDWDTEFIMDLRPFFSANEVKNDSLRRYFSDPSPKIYYPVSSDEGYILENNSEIKYLHKDDLRSVAVIPGKINRNVQFVDHASGALYYLNNNNRFSEVLNGHPSSRELPFTGALRDSMRSGVVRPVLQIERGGIRIVLANNSLYSIYKQGDSIRSDLLIAGLPKGDYMNIGFSMSPDIYALGTFTKGLFILKRKSFWPQRIAAGDGLEINNVYFQLALPDSALFSSNGYVFKEHAVPKQVISRTVLGRYSILSDEPGKMLYFFSGHLHRSDIHLGHDSIYEHLMENDPRGLMKDSSGTIWFGVNEMLWKIDHGRMSHISIAGADTLSGVIEYIFQKSRDTLLLGTRKGLYAYSIKTSRVRPDAQLGNAYVRIIHRTKEGTLLVGTYGDGFYLSYKGGFVKMPSDSKKNLSTAHCFIEDGNGFVWIPTNKGLFQVLKSDLYDYAARKIDDVYYYFYDKDCGFSTDEFNGGCTPCSLTLPDGTVSLPTLDGLLWFRPMDIHPILPDREIFIDYAVVLKDTIGCNASEYSLYQRPSDISLFLSSPYFGDSRNLRIEYRMKDVDSEWTFLGNNRSISYTNLSPGIHQLEIRKRDGFGDNPYKSRIIRITVHALWYETWWFFGLCVIALIGVLSLTVRLRTNYLNKQKKALEQLVNERTKDLSKSNEIKNRLISVLGHDLMSPMRFISSLSTRLHTQMDTVAGKEYLNEVSGEIMKSSRDVYVFTGEFLVWINSQNAGFHIKKKETDILPLIKELEVFFANMLEQNGNRIHVDIDSALILTDRDILKIILRNLIDNANKYTLNGDIFIAGGKTSDQYILRIRDTGKGMTEDQKKRITGDLEATTNSGNSGLGSLIVRDLRMLINCRIAVDSSPGKGSLITLTLELRG